MAECLEFARPWQLLRTATWSLTEAAGLPLATYLVVSALAGRASGVLAGLGVVWLAVAVRKLTAGTVPGLLLVCALLLCVQTALVLATGQAWIYLLQFPVAKLALSAVFAHSAATRRPLVARLATEVVSLRHSGVRSPELHRFFQRNTWLWAGVFAALAVGFGVLIGGVLINVETIAVFLVVSTAATIAAVGAGAGASAVWFRVVLKRAGLRLRFAPG